MRLAMVYSLLIGQEEPTTRQADVRADFGQAEGRTLPRMAVRLKCLPHVMGVSVLWNAMR